MWTKIKHVDEILDYIGDFGQTKIPLWTTSLWGPIHIKYLTTSSLNCYVQQLN